MCQEMYKMVAQTKATRVPAWVPYFNPIARFLLAAGIPMGPDVLLTVRGCKTGLPRTTPVAICENAGGRGVISPFGEVNWVCTLRAAGRATITVGQRKEEVIAVALGPAEAAEFITYPARRPRPSGTGRQRRSFPSSPACGRTTNQHAGGSARYPPPLAP